LFTNRLWYGFAFIFRIHASHPGHMICYMYPCVFSLGRLAFDFWLYSLLAFGCIAFWLLAL
jgi:hypothetical protein